MTRDLPFTLIWTNLLIPDPIPLIPSQMNVGVFPSRATESLEMRSVPLGKERMFGGGEWWEKSWTGISISRRLRSAYGNREDNRRQKALSASFLQPHFPSKQNRSNPITRNELFMNFFPPKTPWTIGL